MTEWVSNKLQFLQPGFAIKWKSTALFTLFSEFLIYMDKCNYIFLMQILLYIKYYLPLHSLLFLTLCKFWPNNEADWPLNNQTLQEKYRALAMKLRNRIIQDKYTSLFRWILLLRPLAWSLIHEVLFEVLGGTVTSCIDGGLFYPLRQSNRYPCNQICHARGAFQSQTLYKPNLYKWASFVRRIQYSCSI